MDAWGNTDIEAGLSPLLWKVDRRGQAIYNSGLAVESPLVSLCGKSWHVLPERSILKKLKSDRGRKLNGNERLLGS
jgi:hypothetical protein